MNLFGNKYGNLILADLQRDSWYFSGYKVGVVFEYNGQIFEKIMAHFRNEELECAIKLDKHHERVHNAFYIPEEGTYPFVTFYAYYIHEEGKGRRNSNLLINKTTDECVFKFL